MTELIERVERTLRDDDFGFVRNAFPLLFSGDLRDQDVLVHSIGCSLWNTLGHQLGYTAIVEAPAPAAAGADIRSDSLWLERRRWWPRALIEFERYRGGTRGQAQLNSKLDNLLEAAMRWDHQPSLLVLSAWSVGVVSAPQTDGFVQRLRDGFNNRSGVRVAAQPQARLLLNQWLFEALPGDRLRLHELSFRSLT